jgi:hypothetical protein
MGMGRRKVRPVGHNVEDVPGAATAASAAGDARAEVDQAADAAHCGDRALRPGRARGLWHDIVRAGCGGEKETEGVKVTGQS